MEKIAKTIVKPQYFTDETLKKITVLSRNNDENYNACVITGFGKSSHLLRFIFFKNYSSSDLNLNDIDSNICVIERNDGNLSKSELQDYELVDLLRNLENNFIILFRLQRYAYRYSEQNILSSFKMSDVKSYFDDYLTELNYSPNYYLVTFNNEKELSMILEFVGEVDIKNTRKLGSISMTGEDIDMFNERKNKQENNNQETICDTHVDGA